MLSTDVQEVERAVGRAHKFVELLEKQLQDEQQQRGAQQCAVGAREVQDAVGVRGAQAEHGQSGAHDALGAVGPQREGQGGDEKQQGPGRREEGDVQVSNGQQGRGEGRDGDGGRSRNDDQQGTKKESRRSDGGDTGKMLARWSSSYKQWQVRCGVLGLVGAVHVMSSFHAPRSCVEMMSLAAAACNCLR